MDFRFVTPRKNPDSEADIFRGYYGGTDFSFVFTKEVGYATFDKPVFALLVINGDDNGMYIFSLSDFDATGPEQLHFKAGWYWFDITSVVLEPVDFYTAFPDGIVFPQNIERPNPTFCETILFETGTTACKLAVLEETKLLMRLSIASKGVDVPDTTPFRQYAGKVGEIQTGDLPKSIKVTIYNSIRAEYDVHYFSSVSGQGPQVIHLSKESDVTFSILSDTPISIEGPQNPEPIIRDVLHSIDAVCLTTSAPGTGENYFSFSTNELFDPGKGVISLEVIDQYG